MRSFFSLVLLISNALVSPGQCDDSLHRKHYVLSAQYNAGIDEMIFKPAFGDQNLRYAPTYWERDPFQMELCAGISYPLPKDQDDCLNSEWLEFGLVYQPTFWGKVAQSYEQRFNIDSVYFQWQLRIRDSIVYTRWQTRQNNQTLLFQTRLCMARQVGAKSDFFMALGGGIGVTLIPASEATQVQSFEIEQRIVDYFGPTTISTLDKGTSDASYHIPGRLHLIGRYTVSAGFAHQPMEGNRLGYSLEVVSGLHVASPKNESLRTSGFIGINASIRFWI